MARIGFMGLGNMGGPMAINLANAGHSVRGFDLVSAARDKARHAGIESVSSAKEAAVDVDIVVTMLSSGRDVLDVYQGVLLQRVAPETLFVDCSTIDVVSARLAHELVSVGGMQALDAPVSGGVMGAVSGSLTFMVGGTKDAVRRATPIFSAMGKKVVHSGPAGTGQAAKICNNLVLGSSMIAASEAFLLGETLDVSRQASHHARDLYEAYNSLGNSDKDFSGIFSYLRTRKTNA